MESSLGEERDGRAHHALRGVIVIGRSAQPRAGTHLSSQEPSSRSLASSIVDARASREPRRSGKALEDRGITPLSGEHEYICLTPTELPEAQGTEVMELIDKDKQMLKVAEAEAYPNGIQKLVYDVVR